MAPSTPFSSMSALTFRSARRINERHAHRPITGVIGPKFLAIPVHSATSVLVPTRLAQ